MFFASNSIPTPEIVWWALIPVIVFAVSGVLLVVIGLALVVAIMRRRSRTNADDLKILGG